LELEDLRHGDTKKMVFKTCVPVGDMVKKIQEVLPRVYGRFPGSSDFDYKHPIIIIKGDLSQNIDI